MPSKCWPSQFWGHLVRCKPRQGFALPPTSCYGSFRSLGLEPWEERAHRFKQVWAWWREPDAGGKRTAWETILGHLTAKYSTSASLRRLFEAVQQHIVNGVLPCQKNGRGVYQAYADKSRSRLRCNDRTCRHILSQFQVLEYFTQLLLQVAIPSTVIGLRPAILAYRVPCNNPTTTDHNPASQL